jgi:nitroreductase
MTITEAIQKRKSIRAYDGKPLSDEHIVQIKDFIQTLFPPFGGEVRIELIRKDLGKDAVKLGTYGSIRGANEFLALIHNNTPMAKLSAGYMMEQAILFCTRLNLGTCWIGGFSKSDFAKQVNLKSNETLSNVSPVGYKEKGIKQGFLPSLASVIVKSHTRKSFEELFFKNEFGKPLTNEEAGQYKLPLEMLRLAPSAMNKQPWRAVLQGQNLHFYHIGSSELLNLDLGIALCHFEQTCKEQNIKGKFEVMDISKTPVTKNVAYVISWTWIIKNLSESCSKMFLNRRNLMRILFGKMLTPTTYSMLMEKR